MDRLPISHVLGDLGFKLLERQAELDMIAVAAMLTALGSDLIAEEPCEFGPGMGDQGLLGGHLQPEVVMQEARQSSLDLLSFIPRSNEAQEESSSPGEFHPQALTEPDGSLATHPALITRPFPALSPRAVPPPRWVDPTTRRDDWAPSLQAHYRPFAATTSPSAPVHRIGTLALVGRPLGLLPWHRGDRFPGSPFEPGSDWRHLHAGRHAGGKRMAPALIPGQRLDPGFDVVLMLSTRHQWFPCGRLSDPYLTRSRRAFSETLTTGALDPSRSRWFGACLRRPAPRGLPSSRTHIAWRTVVRIVDDVGVEPLFVPQGLPAHNEPAHVDVGQERGQGR